MKTLIQEEHPVRVTLQHEEQLSVLAIANFYNCNEITAMAVISKQKKSAN
jgi:hypothetical protein